MGTSKTGRLKYGIVTDEHGNWGVYAQKVKHAANDAETVFTVKVTRDPRTKKITKLEIIGNKMADDSMAQTFDLGEEFLGHFGTKGMKWGVRKAKETKRRIGDVRFESRLDSSNARRKIEGQIHAKARQEFKKTDLPAIKNKPVYQNAKKLPNRLRNPRDPATKAYRKEVKTAYIKRLEEAANSMTNPSGKRQYTIRERGWDLPAEGGALPKSKHFWDVSSREIKHAADEFTMSVEVILDDDGFVTDIKDPVENTMEQSVDLGSEYVLEHFGTKGMKWGGRKARAAGQAVGRGAKKVSRGLAALGAHLADSSWQNSTYSDVRHEAVHNRVAKELDNRVERLQRSPKYRGKNLKADRDLKHAYQQDVAKVTESAYKRAVKETYGENFTGTKSAHYVTDARGPRIEVRSTSTKRVESEAPLTSMKEIQKRRRAEAMMSALTHAETDFPDLDIELTLDDNDQIIGVGFVKPSGNEMEQSADPASAFITAFLTNQNGSDLEHFGVKGMRWGVRRQQAVTTQTHIDTGLLRRRTKLQTQGGESHPAHTDAVRAAVSRQKLKKSGPAALSNQELNDLRNRLQLEAQVELLTTRKGKRFVSKQLEETGKETLKKGTGRTVSKGARKLGGAALVFA